MGERKKSFRFKVGVAVVAALIFYIAAMLLLPTPKPVVHVSVATGKVNTGTAAAMPWPANGQGAVSVLGATTATPSTPLPTASMAKVIVALAVLQKKPLASAQHAPIITLTANDVAIYNDTLTQGGSNVPVTAGEQITQYQALQALLLPSANNMAVSLATWAFGSLNNYLQYANQMVAKLGLKDTRVADASGFSPGTVSSPRDLITLGQLALQQPVLAQIVAQQYAQLPTGQVSNVNADLGVGGINGIKTGNTDQAGGCLLFAAVRQINGSNVQVVGAVQGLASLNAALNAAPRLVNAAYANVVTAQPIVAGQQVATVTVPWAPAQKVYASNTLAVNVWKGADLSLSANVQTNGQGEAKLGSATTKLAAKAALPKASVWWRLTHPQQMLGVAAK